MEKMGGTQNDLSQFSESDWKKCGEIKMCCKQKVFVFSCVHCNESFFQIAIFAQHLRWKHQAENNLKECSDNLSSYTVEELLNPTDGSTTNESIVERSTTDEDAATTTTAATEEDDTGIGSDEELEKEIQELLTSIASNDCSSNSGTELSENDSGFESTSNRQGNRCSHGENLNKPEFNLPLNYESEIVNESETLHSKINSQKVTIVRKNESGTYSNGAFASNRNYLEALLKGRFQKTVDNPMDCRKKTGNTKLIIKKIHKNRVEKKSRSTKEKLNIIDIRRVVKNKNKVPLKKYLETNKFLFGSDDDTEDCVIKNNEKEVLKEQHVKISQPQGTIQSTLIVKSAQGAATNSETSTNTKTIPRTDDKNGEQFINSVRSESGPDINDKAVSEKVDATGGKCGNCLPTEIDKGNATIICTETEAKGNVNAIQFEEIPLTGFEAPVQDGFSGFQREYIIYNEITENVVLAEKSAGQQLKCKSPTIDDNEKPLDLSFNKSTEFTDIQFEEISDLLSTNALHAQTTTELIVEEFDKLLEQQSNATSTNPTNFSDSEHLQNSESIGENQLPPFSKFFKNNANSLKSNDGFMTQSTPKQKTIGQNTIIKRVSQQNLDKENKPSKRKKKVNFVENSAETNTTQKSSIEILSVDIIMPSEGTTSLPLNLHNSNETTTDSPESKPITKGGDNSELTNDEVRVEESTCYHRTSGSIIEDLIPYVKIKKPTVAVPSCGSRVAADSTSEQQPVAFLNEIDYAPEDTLNQLKLECMDDENNLFHSTLQSSANLTASFLSEDHNSTSDESMLLSFSDEDRENYKLLRSTGLQIVMTPNVEDDLCLYKTEEMRTKANCFAKIYCEFKYLWKVGNGVKSYEQIELNFSKLMQRLNEHYKFELSIAQTKRIVNLVSLWYMQTYHRWFIEKKRTSTPILYYLQIFAYLPKTSRRIFYCEECPRYFLSQQKFLTHRRGHVGVPPTCATCQTTYASRGELQLHTNQCATFKCIECDSEFKSAADLEYHLRNNHMFQCEKCGKLCATAADLDWHEHQYPIICGLCNRFYDTALELQKHRQNSFHWDYTCRTCEVFLPTATLMKQHLKLCNGNTNACPI